ncbi:DUF3305 domain-containing protein [Aquabacterium sp. OR-4]|uniref:DUF3305 domain-containing protein n=1 Tax=Aquabacterium sp. OR-4 TaxID=2978127 RepID=UPI0021B165E5|nr:DUF3305 domain-containing protein [Aquabacterium sp. OR-4]MDT7838689.1 DUF3305 domain-containing protein [Aquabacterium sp. OR-4]
MNPSRPSLRVAVLIEREHQPNRWEDWRHRIAEVLLDEGQFDGVNTASHAGADGSLGARPDRARLLRDDGKTAQFLHLGLDLALYADEGEGYYLNLSSGNPVWFVMWRCDEADPSRAWPEAVSVSYNEAGRWLDAQERVDNLPLPAAVRDWLQAYADQHYRPEPKQRKRPASFRAPERR